MENTIKYTAVGIYPQTAYDIVIDDRLNSN